MVDKLTEAKIHIVCGAIKLIQHYYYTFIHKNPCMNSSQMGNKWLREVLDGNDDRCFKVLRMEKNCFYKLCNDLQANYGLQGSRKKIVTEIIGMFLHILGHGVRNELAQEHFQHYTWTVCTYFSKFLDAICLMSVVVLKPQDPEFKDIPIQILNDSRYMHHFKDCIGTIDGVHVQARITPQNQVPFIGRKGTPAQNIMVVCNFDMQFIYALVGCKGNAHDARIFLLALRDPSANFPKPPELDVGYPQIKGFLGPYKNERYHLQVFRQSGQPEGYKEVFNHAHSFLRSVIERTFGVWKKKWKILRYMPSYSFEKQVKIIITTMTFHKYIRRHTKHDRHFAKIIDNYGIVEYNEDLEPHITGVTKSLEMDALRNIIARSLLGM
ncbi:hypothetical protein UlMin_038827 [Ulmus minor]